MTSTADGEEQDVGMEPTAEGAQQEVDDLVADIVATKSGCEFQSVRGDAAKLGGAFFDEAIEVPLDTETEKLRDGLIFASLEALVVSEATRADLATKLEEQEDGSYKAKQDFDEGCLVLPFAGWPSSTSRSKFRISCCGTWLDGTAVARNFPNPWRGVKYGEAQAECNMSIVQLVAPFAYIGIGDGTGFGLKSFEAPAFKTRERLKQGRLSQQARRFSKRCLGHA